VGSALPAYKSTSGYCAAPPPHVQRSRLRLRNLHERLTLRYEHQVCDPESEEYEYPEELPACRGVRAGSIQPCGLWMVRPRGSW